MRRWQKAHKASLRPCISSEVAVVAVASMVGWAASTAEVSMRADSTAVASMAVTPCIDTIPMATATT